MLVHRLAGCTPTPLASYLKALGVLRIVSEQLDPDARGWWAGDVFHLATRFSEEEVLQFFLERYAPTPLVAPWNKGSGFFLAEDRGLHPLEESSAPRFALFRAGVKAARSNLAELSAADREVRGIKTESKARALSPVERKNLRSSTEYKQRLATAERAFSRLKEELLSGLRLAWRGPHREWLDAALVLSEGGRPVFPALLGTGGNDGRLDFTNNFFQRLQDLFDVADGDGRPRPAARESFRAAFRGDPANVVVAGLSVGQFAPSLGGGANTSAGSVGASRLNPADFVLMLEGVVLFAGLVSRRLSTSSSGRASVPFAVTAVPAGYPTTSTAEDMPRGEQWMPLWTAPTSLREVRRLLSEGRMQVGKRQAADSLDVARAVVRLGVARGISEFQRFAYIERNGQSNLAVPVGRFYVPSRSTSLVDCLVDLDVWLPRLRRKARSREAPARLAHAERSLSDALFALTRRPDEPHVWQRALIALAAVESVLVTGAGFEVGPVPALRPDWVKAADDGSPEIRLAVAFGLQGARDSAVPASSATTVARFRWDGVRRHWASLERGRFATTGVDGQRRLAQRPDRVMYGRNPISDAIAVVQRRLLEATQRGDRVIALSPSPDASAHVDDLAHLVSGDVDLERTVELGRAFMALDRKRWCTERVTLTAPTRDLWPDDAWVAIRVALLPWPLSVVGGPVGVDPSIVRRLASGDGAGALTLALRRLRASGMRPALRFGRVEPDTARLWAAALAFPASKRTAVQLARRLDHTLSMENR